MALTTTMTRVTTTKPATTNTSGCSRCSNRGSWGSTMMGLTTTTMRVRRHAQTLWARSADGQRGRQMVRTDGVKCMFFLVLCFLFDIFLFFYSRKRMALLPSPLKGPPDSLPLSSTTTVGKMYVNVHFFWYCFFLFDIFL